MQNKWVRIGLTLLGTLLAIVLVFGAGFFAGRWSVRGSPPGIGLLQRGFLFSGAHGANGVVQEIHDQQIVIQLRDGTTQVILTNDNPRIEKNFKKQSLSDLQIGDRLLVVGTPDSQGQIKARLIRVLEPRAPIFAPDPSKTRTSK